LVILVVIGGLEEGGRNIGLQREGGCTAESGSSHLRVQIPFNQLETPSREFFLARSTIREILVGFGGLEEEGQIIGVLQPSRRAHIIQQTGFSVIDRVAIDLISSSVYCGALGGYHLQF
jgi:hypothetical protein